jgi:hypothetical protein
VVNSRSNTVTVYGRTDIGNVRPLRTLSALYLDSADFTKDRVWTGELDKWAPTGIFVDIENDELFVADSISMITKSPKSTGPSLNSTIKVYRRTDKGNAIPLRTIKGDYTGLFRPSGIFVDNNEIFAVNSGNNTVTVYGRTDEGNISPSRTLFIRDLNNAGHRKKGDMSSGIYVDTDNGEAFVVNENDTIMVYERAY